MIRLLVLALCAGVLAALAAGLLRARFNEPDKRVDRPWSYDTSFVETRSGRAHVLDIGDGPPVLIFHGSGRSLADAQEALAPALAARHRVIAIDHYGFGLSDRGHGWRYGLRLWAEQGRDVLDALAIAEPVIVVGHSAGGAVAALFARANPERTAGVVLISNGIAIAPAQIPMLLPGVGELVFSGPMPFVPDFSPAYRERMAEAYRIRGTRHAMMVFVRRQYTVDGLALLDGTYEGVAAPVLQIHGGADEEIPLSAAQAVQNKLARGRFIVIDGAPHDLHVTHAAQVAVEIGRFARAIKNADGP